MSRSIDPRTPRSDGLGLGGPEPVAIVGIGCRFPGADGPEAFWTLLKDGVDAITEMPPGRFDLDAVYDPSPRTPGKIVTRQGGFLSNLDQFEPEFFRISPREAHFIDPQQRLLLEVSWEAFEDAGIPRARFAGSRTGVFVGMWTNDYEDCMYGTPSDIDLYVTTGGGRYSASGRLSYAFDLQGPSLTVDTACSSSLVAVQLACQSLWSGESALALAGGVNLILQPYITIGYSRSGMLSPDGRCKFADARANGYVRSEGVGVVLLKPSSQAVADGDPIYALIRGGAMNNDGQSSGLLVSPSPDGQEAMLRAAYRHAGVPPGMVRYVEAHGTGTQVGDPVELKALGSVLSAGRPADRRCLIGSVKTNIGHTEAASGIAGLIKVALCLKHRAVPPSLHLQEPNPRVAWDELPFVLPRSLEPWPPGPEPALAGVNSFGITGTNAHVVLQEAPGAPSVQDDAADASAERLFVLSAHSPEALSAAARACRDLGSGEGGLASFPDLCYTAGLRRTHHPHRLALVVRDRAELDDHLEAFLRGDPRPGTSVGRADGERGPKVVFVFSGQGSQWLGMGRRLREREPVFRDAIDRCDLAIAREAGWSPIAEIAADPSRSRLDVTDVVQPMLFTIQVGLASLWRSWGIAPQAVVGHSMGEVAAAHVAGVLSLEDAVRVICRRSRLLRRVQGRGAMAVVDLSAEQASRLLAGYEDRLCVAVHNGSHSTVLSGDPAALDEVIARLEGREVFCRRAKVDVASHSPQMDALCPDLIEALKELQPRPATLPLYSTVTGSVAEGTGMDALYWARNLREPVLFSSAVQRLAEDGYTAFLEVGPHPVLGYAIQQELVELGEDAAVLPSVRREEDERATMLESLGALHTRGHSLDWRAFYPSGGTCVRLFSYPWQRTRFWYDEAPGRGGRDLPTLPSRAQGGHPLLGPQMGSSVHAGTHFWQTTLDTGRVPFLDDHRVGERVVVPAAAYLEMALGAGRDIFGKERLALSGVAIESALPLPEDRGTTVQVVTSLERPGKASFRILSLSVAPEAPSTWTLHAKGTIEAVPSADGDDELPHLSPGEMKRRLPAPSTGDGHYQTMTARGLHYGPRFQVVDQVWNGSGEILGHLAPAESVHAEAGAFQVHPVVLDAALQLLVAGLPGRERGVHPEDTFVPVGLGRLTLFGRPRPGEGLWARGRLSAQAGADDGFDGDVSLFDESGLPLLEARGLRLRKIERDLRRADGCFFALGWEEQAPSPVEAAPAAPTGRWLILAGGSAAGRRLASLLGERGAECVVASPGPTYENPERGRYRLRPESPEDFRRLIEETGCAGVPFRGVVHLWSLDSPPPEDTGAWLGPARDLGCVSALHLVQALAGTEAPSARLWLVTAGAQSVGRGAEAVALGQAPLWGLGRVVANEHPELRCTNVDLGPGANGDEIPSLVRHLWQGGREDQLALRGATTYAARLVRQVEGAAGVGERRRAPAAGRPFRAEVSTPGVIDNLTLRAMRRQAPGPGEVEIEVSATGLNFMNVMSALGIYPGREGGVGTLGLECSGRIGAVGRGVDGLQVGDEVVAVAVDSLATHVVADARLVLRKPAGLGFEEAATIPIAFLTADYALNHLARLQKGERVLIHSAAGGVGLAAVQLAQRAEAEIFATAGSPEKRDYLRSLGVRHVMDSRSLSFVDAVAERTGGEGVDVVLNSLSGEAIARSLATLRPYGRFLEIGKRDIHEDAPLGLGAFKKALSYFAIDLDRMIRERPELLAGLFRDVMRRIESGELKAIPHRAFGVGHVADAFRHMAMARHTGKIVITADREAAVEEPSAAPRFAEGTYLVTGGLGGLGLTVARWMTEQGARHLVLAGRSAPSPAAERVVKAWTDAGLRVNVAGLDVADRAQVDRLLAEIDATMPPLRGVVHAAGILDDGVLLDMNADRFAAVMAPKALGAWNLHAATAGRPLDLFVMFSSVASLLGSPGQGNYAAANAFLDALAAHRRREGKPALAVQWGPWRDVGLAAARADRGERLARRGLGSLHPDEGLAALGRLLREAPAEAVVMRFEWRQWCASEPAAAASPLFLRLAREGASASPAEQEPEGRANLRQILLAREPGPDRQARLELYLQERVAQVLRVSTSRVDRHRPLRTLGLDSLMALELRNRLEVDLGLSLPATVVWNYPTVSALAPHLGQRMGVPLDADRRPAETPSGGRELDRIVGEIERLSAEEARELLDE